MSDSSVNHPASTGQSNQQDFSAATFAHLDPVDLIQAFNDQLAEIDHEQKTTVKYDDMSTTVVRILEFLRVLKYMPPGYDPTAFRDGIAEGNPDIIVPIMGWIFERKDILRKRAYLGKYLVKLELPDVMAHDEDAVKSYMQYETLMGKFVEVHKEFESLKSRKGVTGLLEYIEKSEYDQECLRRKIDYVKSRMDSKQSKTMTLAQAKALRLARQKKDTLIQQMKLEENFFRISEARKVSTRREYQKVANMYNSVTPEGILNHMEEDVLCLTKVVNQTAPKEIKYLERRIRALKHVEGQPPEGQEDIKYLKTKVSTIQEEVKMLQGRAKIKERNEPLFMARQKAIASGRKRKLMFEEAQLLSAQLEELQDAKEQIIDEQTRRFQIREHKEKKLRKYLKIKVEEYKEHRKELELLKSETGVMSSTKFIIEGKLRENEKELEDVEKELGITGLSRTQEKLESISSEKNVVDEQKNNLLREMSYGVRELDDKIKAKKVELEPLVKSLNALRERDRVTQIEHDNLRTIFNNCAHESTSKITLLLAKIRAQQEELSKDELNYLELKAIIPSLKMKIKLTTQEKLHQTRDKKNPNEDRVRSLKQKLLRKIVEQEREGTALKTELDNIDNFLTDCVQQRKMWNDTARMLEWKLSAKELEFDREMY